MSKEVLTTAVNCDPSYDFALDDLQEVASIASLLGHINAQIAGYSVTPKLTKME